MKDYKLHSFTGGAQISFDDNLNPQQLRVVKEADGPALVLAGAGSGKTRVLIYRLAYLLHKGIRPENILLVTFTNKASQEMTHRAEALLKSSLSGLWAGTFHHIGNMILRKEGHLLGFAPNFTILDREDSLDVIDDCIDELGYYKNQKAFPKKDVIASIGGIAVNSQRDIGDVIATNYNHLDDYALQIKRVLHHYEKKKKETNTMDFNDLLKNWIEVLTVEEVAKKYSQTFEYILVDEYQDTNRLQFEILRRLAAHHKNILAVGDDAQSIYSFRGAEIHNLLDFPKRFDGARIFKLEINYRSTPQILKLANEVITHNINQFPKALQAIKDPAYTPIAVKTKDVYMQAAFVAQRLLELTGEGIPLKEIAVLFRSHFQILELELELLKRNIPYIVRGGVRFFEQAHIKDVMAHLKVILNPKDELSFKRAVALHKGIGRSYAHKIWAMLSDNMALDAIQASLPKRQQEGLRDFFSSFKTLKTMENPQDMIQEVLKFYKDYCYLTFDNPDDRILDLEELAKMATHYPTVKRFITELGSYEEFKGETMLAPSQKEEFLTLSTIHQAKGLEWEAVFIIGFSDYEFPHPKALNKPSALEEERRLFYVASTRAKSILYITYPETKYTFKNGLIISRPSVFLQELSGSVYEEMNVEVEE